MIIEEVLVQEGVCREPQGRFVVYPPMIQAWFQPLPSMVIVYRSGDERGAILRELLDETVLSE